MKRYLCALVISASLVVLAPSALLAWEEDLHYGLTKWLAYKAGFSLADAETIALGTIEIDR